MNDEMSRRITPWVGRLLAINAVILLLQQTVVTSDVLENLLRFDPALAFHRPWTFVTYMFLHGGFVHLLFNSIALFVFGPPVERRLGSTTFIVYYLYCGVGAAIFSLALSGVMPVAPFIGASGAILGVAFAFARLAPDAELLIFPIPMPIKASRLVWLLVAIDVVGALLTLGGGGDNVAHLAHLGGLAAGWFFFMLQSIARPSDPPRLPTMRPRVPVTAGTVDASRHQPSVSSSGQPSSRTAAPQTPGANEAAEIDRVLDKISASGIASLTAEERRFLDAVASRRRGTPN